LGQYHLARRAKHKLVALGRHAGVLCPHDHSSRQRAHRLCGSSERGPL